MILPLVDKAHMRRVFDDGILRGLTWLGFEGTRIDTQVPVGGMVEAIRAQIARAYFVIADLSHERPNCYYELGIAHALSKPVLLIKDKTTKLHFDVAHHMVHEFSLGDRIDLMTIDLVPKLLTTSHRESKDTRNGQFGRVCIKNNYRLGARVIKCNSKECYLDFEVCSVDPKRPLSSPVTFYLHEAYKRSVKTIAPRHGFARYLEVQSHDGPWTLGVEVDDGETRLELDLATIPGATDAWYRKAYKLMV